MANFSSDHTPVRSPWERPEQPGNEHREAHAAPTDSAIHRPESSDRQRRISEAAYLRAQRRGFCPGFEEQDWLEAEQEIDATATKQHWSESKYP